MSDVESHLNNGAVTLPDAGNDWLQRNVLVLGVGYLTGITFDFTIDQEK